MVLKRGFDMPGGVSIIGPVHGVLLTAYVADTMIRERSGWTWRQAVSIVLPGVSPIAGFFVAERSMKQSVTVQPMWQRTL